LPSLSAVKFNRASMGSTGCQADHDFGTRRKAMKELRFGCIGCGGMGRLHVCNSK